jgi:hypothetical protein
LRTPLPSAGQSIRWEERAGPLSAVEANRRWAVPRGRLPTAESIEVSVGDLQEFFQKVRPVVRGAGFQVIDEAPSSVADRRGGGLPEGIVGFSLGERARTTKPDSIWAHPMTRLCEVLAGISVDAIGAVLVTEGSYRTVAEVSPLVLVGAVLVGDGIMRSIITTYRSELILVTAADATTTAKPDLGFPTLVRLSVRAGRAVTFEGSSARHVRKIVSTEESDRLAGSILEALRT